MIQVDNFYSINKAFAVVVDFIVVVEIVIITVVVDAVAGEVLKSGTIRNDPEQWSQIRSTWTLKLNISAVTIYAVVVITMNKQGKLYFLSMW